MTDKAAFQVGRRAVAASDDLAADLHEVSNALTVVVGWLEVAFERSQDTATRDALQVALGYARFGLRVARRAIGSSAEPDATSRSLGDVIRGCLLAVEPVAEGRQVRTRLVPETCPRVMIAAPDSAMQILVNLLLNAIAFSPENGQVSASVSVVGEHVKIEVADQGPGIDKARVGSILEAPDSTRRGGAGIGLTHSRALAMAHSGSLELKQYSPSAVFELTWPVAADTADIGGRPAEVDLAVRRVVSSLRARNAKTETSVLLLEDDSAIVSLVELAFGNRGVEVTSAANFEQACDRADKGKFDVALVDLSPIGADVAGAVQRLRSRSPDLPLILITGSPMGIPSGLEAEFATWVRKPFEAGELFEVVCQVLERA